MNLMDANKMTSAPHPAYSPGLAPSDFFLFEDVKQPLGGCSLDQSDDLPTSVQEILDSFDKPALIRVFEKWVRKLDSVLRQKESTLDELKITSGFIRFGLVNMKMLMGA
jgi:hypothetical protein